MKIKVFLLIMCLPVFLFCQGGTFTTLGEWGAGAYWDVFVKDNYAYCAAEDGGVDIIDISAKGNPRRITSIDTSDAYNVCVAGDYLYVARRHKDISIFNISNPASPWLAGNYTSRNVATGIKVSGQYAFVINNYLDVTGSYGELLILDISSPSNPVQVSKFNSAKILGDLSIYGNHVYLTAAVDNPFAPEQDGWMLVVDISDITSPQQVGTYDTPGAAWGIFASGNYAYIADGSTGLQIIGISDPTAPTPKGAVDTPGQYAFNVQTLGNIAYIANGVEGLAVVDVSNPSAPVLLDNFETRWNTNNLHVEGNYAYLANTYGGLNIIDISTPATPSLAGTFDQSIHLREVEISGDYAFIGSNDGLRVFDVSNPSNPVQFSYYQPYNWMETLGHNIGGNILYLLNGEGLETLDISNPVMIRKIGDRGILPSDGIRVEGNYIYVVEAFHGLSIYDVSDPANIVYKGALDTGSHGGNNIFVSKNVAYISGNRGLYIIDVSEPTAPSTVTVYNRGQYYRDVFVHGDYAFLTGAGLTILDVSNPASPSLAFKFDGFYCQGIFVEGKYAYVAANDKGLRIFDISNAADTVLVGSYTSGAVEHVTVKNDIIYAVDGPSGRLRTLSFTPPPRIGLDKTSLNFSATTNGWVSGPQTVYLNNTGAGTLTWTAYTAQDWLKCSPESGGNSDVLSVSVNPAGLSAGTYNGTITVSAPDALNSPQTIGVNLKVSEPSALNSPFGEFATPLDNSTVRSSIPVTGWALDDIGVQSVKIYRGTGNNLVYIGDAVFVEGARPDVQAAYPDYPNNSRAGWGYMLLTNFLPNGGNGSYSLHAIAQDAEGNQVTLGTKTIHCDNANAILPFGAIDTPTQGGVAWGNSYVNFGWALTPQPNNIATDGTTIDVWVDGVNLGHPVYNNYRSDIANLFPGYYNSEGAVGYFYLDATAYANGVHTIQWTVRDSAGNSDGIGSRYFIVQNQGTRSASAQATAQATARKTGPFFPGSSKPNREPVAIKKGFDINAAGELMQPDELGFIRLEIQELERLEINVFPLGQDKRLLIPSRPLPIGSSLEPDTGIYRWMPGPGFTGLHHLVFDIKEPDGTVNVQRIVVKILPRNSR